MSSLTIGQFSLNEIIIRKPLQFPDGTIQSTAYAGTAGEPTLQIVLTAGSSAGGLNITDVGTLEIASGSNVSLLEQSGINLQIQSCGGSNTDNSTISLFVTDGAANNVEVVTVSDALVTIVPALDVTSVVFPDTSTQISAPRFLTLQTLNPDVVLTNGVSVNVTTFAGLAIGSYMLSGYIQNTATVSDVTAIQSHSTFGNGTTNFISGYSSLSTCSIGEPAPSFPINLMFKNTVANSTYTLAQQDYFSGGTYTQTYCQVSLFYIGA